MGRIGRDRRDSRIGKMRNFRLLTLLLLVLTLSFAWGQSQLPEGPKPQNNAPQNPPQAPAPQNNSSDSQPSPGQSSPLPSTPPPGTDQSTGTSSSTAPQPSPGTSHGPDTASDTAPGPEPNPAVRTVPPGSVPNSSDRDTRNELFRLRVNVNFVLVPVTVKDSAGHLVDGLLSKDFAIYENGVKQNIRFFTSDPFPLSAAVVIDLGMSDTEVSKVRETLPALISAFGQFDEVSIFTYGNTVKKWQDFTAASNVSAATLRQLKAQKGSTPGAPVVGGPLGQKGPMINGQPEDRGQMTTMPTTVVKQSRVLNDAILAAAADLGKRDRSRRKVVFVISDGRELGSTASYADVMKVLLSNEVSVYAVGVGGSAIPAYGTLQKFRIPGFGYGDILPKYASATGGQVFAEFTQRAIETAYARVTEEARNQYTVGYTARVIPSSAYRGIEVRVNRTGLKVYAKDGYYPLPPQK
jgi:VWFA-related protein